METDIAQMLAFCLVMIGNALADPGVLQNAGVAIAEAEASLDMIRAGLGQELSADEAAAVISEIGEATGAMTGTDREEAASFCVDMASQP